MRTIFNEYELKIILYTADSSISDEDLDLLERDSFRRYNSGMTPLKKDEIARAKYDGDFLTEELANLFDKDKKIYQKAMYLFLPTTKREKLDDREKIKEFERIVDKLYLLKKRLYEENNELKENILFLKSIYWMLSILYRFYSKEFIQNQQNLVKMKLG